MITTSLLLLGLLSASPSPAQPACPPAGTTRASLAQLKAKEFEIADAIERNDLALKLTACLEDPDPEIRDRVAFEALSTWLRKKALTPPTILALAHSLKTMLAGPADRAGFRLPFAALALSEVARADRIEPVFTDALRAELVDLAASSFSRVEDYRGFDEKEGWRHGVAHGADLLLQLGVNPKVGAEGLKKLMDAAQTQISPQGAVFYTYGEPERIARAVNFTYRRGVLDAAYWDAWFTALADPRPFANWGASYTTRAGLARRHNRIALAHAIGFAGRAAGDDVGKALAALADRAATQIMGG